MSSEASKRAKAFLKTLLPGRRYVVLYPGETIWRERMTGWPVQDGEWIVVNPDGRHVLEDLSCGGVDGQPVDIRELGPAGRLPAGLKAKAYRFSTEIDDDTRRKWFREARGMAARLCEEREVVLSAVEKVVKANGRTSDLDEFYGGSFVPGRILGKTSPTAIVTRRPHSLPPPRPLIPDLKPPTGTKWIAAESNDRISLGDEVVLDYASGDTLLDTTSAAKRIKEGVWVRCEAIVPGSVQAYEEKRKRDLVESFIDSDALPELKSLKEKLGLVIKSDLPGGAAGSTTPTGKEGDALAGDEVRTLWIDIDDHGERYKEWRKVVQESTVERWKDSPLQTPPSALQLAKYFERHGGDPRRWLQEWMRVKQIQSGDRICHELRTLIDAFHYGGSFDQLNVGALVIFEVLALRIQLILEAYQNPAKPNWESARYFSGTSSIDDGVQVELKNFVTRKAKDDAEVWYSRNRARELRRSADPVEEGLPDASAGGVNKKGNKGGGRGRKGQLPPSTE